jgi:hypothetical protein
MKKLLLILSFLASQLLAIECTKEQYKPYFDKNNDRYMYSYNMNTDNSEVVIDKKSVVYDKVNQKIVCWVIYQTFESPKYGKYKALWEYNLKNNQARVIEANGYECNDKVINEESKQDWHNISPNSGKEWVLNSLKKYLNIK